MGLAQHLVNAVLHPIETRSMIHWAVWRDPLHRIEDDPETSGWNRPQMKRCWTHLDNTSRSFASVIKELEGELSRVVCIYYLILRALDTVEDDMTLDIEVKSPILEKFYQYLEQDGWNFQDSGPDEKDRALLQDFEVVIAEYKSLPEHYKKPISDITKNMGKGMSRYCRLHAESGGKFSVDTLASFDLYCHYVAGLVGEGLSRLFSASEKEIPGLGEQLTLSNSMGLLLQKTNITRDFREDADEGRVFWPAEIWSKYVTKAQDLHAAGNEEKALWALSEMTVDALAHATDALDYLTLLRNQSIFNFCAIPQVMAIATLETCFMNPNVFKRNVKIRKSTAVFLMSKAFNPRDVAYIFREYMWKIHAKARPNDPSFIKIAVLTGRIEQWCENRYPSFVVMGEPIPTHSGEWKPGMDARIKQLPPPDPALVEAARLRQERENPKMSTEDMKFIALIFGGLLLVIAFIGGLASLLVWWLFIRENSWYGENDLAGLARQTAQAVAAQSDRIEL